MRGKQSVTVWYAVCLKHAVDYFILQQCPELFYTTIINIFTIMNLPVTTILYL